MGRPKAEGYGMNLERNVTGIASVFTTLLDRCVGFDKCICLIYLEYILGSKRTVNDHSVLVNKLFAAK